VYCCHYRKMNAALCEVVEEHALVTFETLQVEVHTTVLLLEGVLLYSDNHGCTACIQAWLYCFLSTPTMVSLSCAFCSFVCFLFFFLFFCVQDKESMMRLVKVIDKAKWVCLRWR